MISYYQRHHPGEPPSGAPSDRDRDRDDRRARGRGDGTEAHLEALYGAGKDAARHGLDVARIHLWRLQDAAVAGAGRLFLLLLAAVAVIGVVSAIAIWGTVHVLSGLAAVVGGGLAGSLFALLVVLGTLVLLASMIRYRRRKARAAALRRRLGLEVGGAVREEPEHEPDEFEKMRRQSVERLRADKDRALAAGAGVLHDHPVATLGVSAASGFVVSRLLRKSPRAIKKATVTALRAGRAVGLAGLMSAAKQAVGREVGRDAG